MGAILPPVVVRSKLKFDIFLTDPCFLQGTRLAFNESEKPSGVFPTIFFLNVRTCPSSCPSALTSFNNKRKFALDVALMVMTTNERTRAHDSGLLHVPGCSPVLNQQCCSFLTTDRPPPLRAIASERTKFVNKRTKENNVERAPPTKERVISTPQHSNSPAPSEKKKRVACFSLEWNLAGDSCDSIGGIVFKWCVRCIVQ
ncbi:hypothetical protein PM082_010743 [Marasmius tenuissimus]|nr:hypothetical protein PM082_010743 [Marasmius tenuissimus]